MPGRGVAIHVLYMLAAAGMLVAQRQPVEDAWDLLAKGERAKAAQLLRQIVKANPRDAEARLMLGSLLSEDGDKANALAQLEEAVRLRPRSAEVHHALGEALDRFSETQAARAEFEQAVLLDPNFAQARVDLGRLLLQAGSSAEATRHLDAALKLMGPQPDAAYAKYLRAKIYGEEGDTHKAAATLKDAVTWQPDFAEAWSDLGQARKMLLDDAGALAAFQRSVELAADNAVAQYRLGNEYLQQGNPRKAVEHLQQAFRLNPKDQSTLNSLQMALRQNGQVEESRQVKMKLVEVLREIDVESQRAFKALRLNNEGAALEGTGDLRGALARYKEALDLDPSHNGIRVNLAVVSLRLGLWAEGLAGLREAQRRDPANPNIGPALEDALQQAPVEFGGKGKTAPVRRQPPLN